MLLNNKFFDLELLLIILLNKLKLLKLFQNLRLIINNIIIIK